MIDGLTRTTSARGALLGLTCLVTSYAPITSSGLPSIHEAAALNDTEFVKGWIISGRNVDHEYNNRSFAIHGSGGQVRKLTPLMNAAGNGNFEVVKLLVDAGADIYRESTRADGYGEGTTVFDYAVSGGDVRTIEYLWDASDGKRMRKHLSTNFLVAFNSSCSNFPDGGSRELLQFFLTTFDHKHASDALWRISDRQRCAPAVHFILNNGIPPTSSALVTAARVGVTDFVALYLKRGADINAYGQSSHTSSQGNVTPLIASAMSVRLETMRLLLREGADPNLQDSRGRTALIVIISKPACSRIHPSCENRIDGIRLLLQHGARLDIPDRSGKTAMDYVDLYPSDPYRERKRELLTKHAR